MAKIYDRTHSTVDLQLQLWASPACLGRCLLSTHHRTISHLQLWASPSFLWDVARRLPTIERYLHVQFWATRTLRAAYPAYRYTTPQILTFNFWQLDLPGTAAAGLSTIERCDLYPYDTVDLRFQFLATRTLAAASTIKRCTYATLRNSSFPPSSDGHTTSSAPILPCIAIHKFPRAQVASVGIIILFFRFLPGAWLGLALPCDSDSALDFARAPLNKVPQR
ncbi:hypothetical protein MSAN_02074600 [Mycena sanguinolenta]|uniref:Uncharacterized protein n=1 Tax=Mycena sanguinolenta TaxID=230812 RepID=A0A8H7CNH3_9AGAR|nr:hypothetical protein MSAN_02074600 [Mycena sanguinolenta]